MHWPLATSLTSFLNMYVSTLASLQPHQLPYYLKHSKNAPITGL